MSKRKYVVMRVLNRGLVDVPIHNDNKRARNWCATVSPDPNAPGGMARKFWSQARGQAAEIFKYIIPENICLYDVIEFGADYVSYGGRRSPERWYGVVLALNETQFYACPCDDAVTAFTTAVELRESMKAKPPSEPAAAAVDEPAKRFEHDGSVDWKCTKCGVEGTVPFTNLRTVSESPLVSEYDSLLGEAQASHILTGCDGRLASGGGIRHRTIEHKEAS